jgi:hypothetical protein
MHAMAVLGLILVSIGAFLILLGAWMSVVEWRKKLVGSPGAKPSGVGSTLTGLAKLMTALKDYPTGQRMIVFGIVVVIIGGVIGGVSGL